MLNVIKCCDKMINDQCSDLAHWRDYSYCRASEEISQKCLAHMHCRKYLKTRANGEIFVTPHPPDCHQVA